MSVSSPTEPVSPRPRDRRSVRVLAWGALVLAVGFLLWRGIWPAVTGSGDLTTGYSAGRAWLVDRDPYDLGVLEDELSRAGGGELVTGLNVIRNVYFPTSLPIFVPIAIFDWPLARLIALAINVGAALVIVLGLARLLGWRPQAPAALGIAAVFAALAPLRETFFAGQTGLVAVAALVAAALLERSGRRLLAGMMYGLATAAKIQIGLPFLAYVLWRRRWGTAAVAGAMIAGLSALSVLRMGASGVPWFGSWMANLDLLDRPGGLNDVGPLNPLRYSLINLQFPLASLGATGLVGLVIDAVTVGAAAVAIVWLIRGRYPREELLALSTVAVLGLLVTYHRYYDAVLLAFPIAWAFSTLSTTLWRQGVIVLILCADFSFSIQTNLRNLQVNGLLPTWLTENLVWDAVVLAQQVWALVLMALVMLWAAAVNRRDVSRLAPEVALGEARPLDSGT